MPEMYERLLTMIRQRRDTGFSLAIADNTLEPKNPFESKARRRPQTRIAVGGVLAFAIGAVFVYFSFH